MDLCVSLCYLDVAHHSSRLHSAGHVDCVAPDVIVRFTSPDHSSKNCSFIHTWRDQWADMNTHGNTQTERYAHAGTYSPMRSMKLLKDCLLRLSRVTLMAKAKSARSARCCQRSVTDWSSGCGITGSNFYQFNRLYEKAESYRSCYKIPPCGCCIR